MLLGRAPAPAGPLPLMRRGSTLPRLDTTTYSSPARSPYATRIKPTLDTRLCFRSMHSICMGGTAPPDPPVSAPLLPHLATMCDSAAP